MYGLRLVYQAERQVRAYKEVTINMPVIQVRWIDVDIFTLELGCTKVDDEAVSPRATWRIDSLFSSEEILDGSPRLLCS